MSLTRTELKDIQSLLTKKGRKQQKKFLAEGVRLLEEALRHAVQPERLFLTPAGLSPRGEEMVRLFRSRRVRVDELSARQLESLSDTKTPQGMIGLFRIPSTVQGELSLTGIRNILVCENVGDPGNLGTLIRSALAFGFSAIVIVGETAEPFSPKVVRSSAGTIFGVSIIPMTRDQVLAYVDSSGSVLLAAAPHGNVSMPGLAETAGQRQLLLVVGSEADGISAEMLKAARIKVRIGHDKQVESLNVAVAGSILMKEIYSSCTENK